MELLSSLALIALLVVATSLVLKFLQFESHTHPPPGPPGVPFVGNALEISKETPWLKFTEWSDLYGEIVFARVFSRKLVVINSFELATQMFENAKYSDRPRRRMAELSGYDKTLLFMNYGEGVRHSRRLIHTGLGGRHLHLYHAAHVREARMFAKSLLNDPSGFIEHIRGMLTASLLRFTYGHEVEDDNGTLAALARGVVRVAGDLISPNRHVVDIFPLLNLLPDGWPGTDFKRVSKQNRDVLSRFMEDAFAQVYEQRRDGIAKPSFVFNHLENKTDDLERLKWTSGMIGGAGLETTASVLSSFFLLMIRHPDVQKRAQREIDTVLASHSLPTFSDQESLPFLECVIKEIFRWHPPSPLISRTTREDDVVNNYTIPSGSYIMANIWAFTHDPSLYPEPFEFNPDRFLPTHGTNPVSPPDPRLYTFGFGRRGCPGIHLANNIVFIMIATTLAVFDILPEMDEKGRPKIPGVEYTETLISNPLPFGCRIIARSQEATDLIAYAVGT